MLCTPALVVYGADVPGTDKQRFPPYREKALSVEVGARAEFDSRFVASNTITTTVLFSATNGAGYDNAPLGELSVPAPVAGAIPIVVIRSAGWIGKVQWRELQSGKWMGGSSPDVFQEGVIYAAQITWVQSGATQPASNVLQMPQGAYREGRILPARKNTATSSVVAPNVDKGAVQEPPLRASASIGSKVEAIRTAPSYNVPVTSVTPKEFIQTSEQIILPDLGEDPESIAPAKNSSDLLAQTYPNTQAGVPSFNAGPGATSNPFLPGANDAPMPDATPAVNFGAAGGTPGVATDAGTSTSVTQPASNALQIPQGAYRESRTLQAQKNLATSNLDSAVTPSVTKDVSAEPSPSASVSVSAKPIPIEPPPSYSSPATSNLPKEFTPGSRQIVLPDLGGEPDPLVPTKKTSEPVQQTYPNSQAGIPNINAGQFGGINPGLPGANNAPMPGGAPAISLGGAGLGGSLGATGSKFHYESKNYLANVGLDYVSPKSNYGIGLKADGAALLGKTYAIGTNLTFNNINEAVVNAVWMPEDTNIKTKLSAAYMWGQQNFDFYSGNSSASLTQASYYFSTQYVVPKERSDYLHSIGLSTWSSKAKQTNNPNPNYSTVETASSYNIMMDPLKLAVGTLQGEALDTQVGITKQVIAKASMGYESLKFPFSDGTQELNKRIYQDYVVQYQPIQEVSLQAGYKMGAALNNVMLSAAYSQWKVTGFKNNGNNGITGNQGVMLSYNIPLDGKNSSVPVSALTRPELIGNSAYILRDAAIRPVQLPQTFLAKVDTTAVTMLASISKAGLGSGASVNSQGQVLANVGTGNGTISGVTRNGASYAYTSIIVATATGIMINTLKLPAALSSGDAYVVSITDSINTPYLVNFTTAN